MILMSGEEAIVTFNGSRIMLTNFRILMNSKSWGNAFMISVFLEDVSSIQTKYSSVIIFAALAVLLFIAGGMVIIVGNSNEENIGMAAIVFGVVFTLLYFLSRRHIVSIMSNGGVATNFSISGMKREAVEKFILDVSEAKLNRVNSIRSKN